MMVSVIIATYNRAHLIRETLDSLVGQTYTDWEGLIIDDGCIDDTARVVEEYTSKDKRIKFFKRSDQHQNGLSGCRNYALSLAIGAYVQFFDDDDIMHPRMLEIKVRYLEKWNRLDFVVCQYDSFYGNLQGKNTEVVNHKAKAQSLEENISLRYLLNEVIINSVGPLWRSGVFQTRRFDENLHYAEEWDLYNKMFIDGIVGYEISEILFFYRKHELSNTGKTHPRGKDRMKEEEKAKLSVFYYLLSKGRMEHQAYNFFIKYAIKQRSLPLILQFQKQRKNIQSEKKGLDPIRVFIVYLLFLISGKGLRFLKDS
jgi:GalNAc5-diNAcBac-PP-undecaprenol beta-1,3-glucosyltransferase